MKKLNLKFWNILLYVGLLLGIIFFISMLISIPKTQEITEAKNNFCIDRGYKSVADINIENHTIRCFGNALQGEKFSCKGEKWC